MRISAAQVEGAEIHVLRSLLPTIRSIANLVVETSPGWWTERFNLTRNEGASLYASLFERHGFALGYTSSGRWVRSAHEMRSWIHSFSSCGYWSQEDIWIGRDLALMEAAVRRRSEQTGVGGAAPHARAPRPK